MSTTAGNRLDYATEAAIDWLVLMRSGAATATERRELEEWLARSPDHQRAWLGLAGRVDAAFAPAREVNQRHPGQADALASALVGSAAWSRRRRRLLQGALAVGGMGVATGLLIDRQIPLGDLLSDWQTGTGERRDIELADGSRLLLNARSAADSAMTDAHRGLRLWRGEVIVDAVAGARPFVLAGAHGSLWVEARQPARILLRQEEERSLAVAWRNPITLASVGGRNRLLQPGEAAWFGPGGIAPAPDMATTAAAWQRGQLEVHADRWEKSSPPCVLTGSASSASAARRHACGSTAAIRWTTPTRRYGSSVKHCHWWCTGIRGDGWCASAWPETAGRWPKTFVDSLTLFPARCTSR